VAPTCHSLSSFSPYMIIFHASVANQTVAIKAGVLERRSTKVPDNKARGKAMVGHRTLGCQVEQSWKQGYVWWSSAGTPWPPPPLLGLTHHGCHYPRSVHPHNNVVEHAQHEQADPHGMTEGQTCLPLSQM
jgi:hypothetical protein